LFVREKSLLDRFRIHTSHLHDNLEQVRLRTRKISCVSPFLAAAAIYLFPASRGDVKVHSQENLLILFSDSTGYPAVMFWAHILFRGGYIVRNSLNVDRMYTEISVHPEKFRPFGPHFCRICTLTSPFCQNHDLVSCEPLGHR